MDDREQLLAICNILSERVVEQAAEIIELRELAHNRARYAGGLRAEIKRLREALAWYVGRPAESLMFDGGRRASRALSGEADDA